MFTSDVKSRLVDSGLGKSLSTIKSGPVPLCTLNLDRSSEEYIFEKLDEGRRSAMHIKEKEYKEDVVSNIGNLIFSGDERQSDECRAHVFSFASLFEGKYSTGSRPSVEAVLFSMEQMQALYFGMHKMKTQPIFADVFVEEFSSGSEVIFESVIVDNEGTVCSSDGCYDADLPLLSSQECLEPAVHEEDAIALTKEDRVDNANSHTLSDLKDHSGCELDERVLQSLRSLLEIANVLNKHAYESVPYTSELRMNSVVLEDLKEMAATFVENIGKISQTLICIDSSISEVSVCQKDYGARENDYVIVDRLTRNSDSLDLINETLDKLGNEMFGWNDASSFELSAVTNRLCEIGNRMNELACLGVPLLR
jgi:hypothetical protein